MHPLTLAGDSAARHARGGGGDRCAMRAKAVLASRSFTRCLIRTAIARAQTEAHAPMLTLDDVHRYRALYWEGGLVDALGDGDRCCARRYRSRLRVSTACRPLLAIGAEHDPLRDDARASNGFARPAGPRITGWERGWCTAAGALGTAQAARLHRTVGGFLLAPHA